MWSIAMLNKTSSSTADEDEDDKRHLRHKGKKKEDGAGGGGDGSIASETMWCHLEQYYNDDLLDKFAEFGINSVRIPVGHLGHCWACFCFSFIIFYTS